MTGNLPYPTFYHATHPAPVPLFYAYQPDYRMQAAVPVDATMDAVTALNDPSRWIIKRGVPIFKTHERVDPATNKLIKVDVPKLYEIAANISQMERGGVPIRMTIGHTEPGKTETEQPPVVGYYKNARVQPFGPKQELAIVVDELLDPQWAAERAKCPYRSSEYYDDTKQITGVALLTRDPFLDLGIVGGGPIAYARYMPPGSLIAHTSASPVTAQLNPATGRVPVMYRLTLGETPMFPQNGTPTAPNPQQMQAFLPPGYMPAPQVPMQYAAVPGPVPQQPVVGYAYPQPAPIPTPYGMPVLGDWGGPTHRANIGHDHPSQWNYGRFGPRPPARYADGPPGGPGGGPPPGAPPGGPGGGGNPLEVVYQCLTEAVGALQQLMQASTQAPQEPFPGGGGGGGPPPMMSSAYGAYPQRGRGPAPRGRMPRMYSRDGQVFVTDPRTGQPVAVPPQVAAQIAGQPPVQDVPRTISGLPVGYQLKMDQMQYQLNTANHAIKTLMYERNNADTATCIETIRRLADAGYPVSEAEVTELKNKQTPQARAAYIDTITTKYQRVPTDHPPHVLGDPTPGYAADPQARPATQEEMDQALQMSANDPRPDAFTNAINYIRSNRGSGTQYGTNRIANLPNPQQMAAAAANSNGWAPGGAAPGQNGFDPQNPYGV